MKNLLFIGQFRDASGYANVARGFLRVLDKNLNLKEYQLKIFSLDFEKKDFSVGTDAELIKKYSIGPMELLSFINNNKYTLFLCGMPHYYNIDSPQMPVKPCIDSENCTKAVDSFFWETDGIPTIWKDVLSKNVFDELIVSCKWNKELFEKEIKTSIVFPLIQDYYELAERTKNNKFTIFTMSQWQHRKGFDILLRAYYQEFFDQEDVQLVIKTYRSETSVGSSEETERQIIINDILQYKLSCLRYGYRSTSKVLLKSGYCSSEEIKEFYQTADVFCLPTRGEGFGLTIAQAALSGVPCVVPNIGGHVDFIDPDASFLINSSFEPVINMPFNTYSSVSMNLIEPSLLSTRKQLRMAYKEWKENPQALLSRGQATKNYAQKLLNEKNSFDSLMSIL